MKNDLKLATAQAGWNRGENDDNWYVKTPEGDVLFKLKGNFDETTAMQAIRLGREFELEAFNLGIEYGKQIAEKNYKNEKASLLINNKMLSDMNEKIANRLDKELNKEY